MSPVSLFIVALSRCNISPMLLSFQSCVIVSPALLFSFVSQSARQRSVSLASVLARAVLAMQIFCQACDDDKILPCLYVGEP